MFKKLVANLPFNPSLITQVSFYAERLKQENAIRRLSFLFIIGAMLIQMFAVVAPPEKSLAAGGNHILDGLSESRSPAANKDFLLQSWDANTGNIQAIYGYFGVTRQDIVNMAASHERVNSVDGNDWWTTGRNSLTGYTNIQDQFKRAQVAIEYAPGEFIYQRQLVAWNDVYGYEKSWVGMRGTIASTGQTFWILLDCGNFTTIGRYIPPPPPPPPPPVIGANCSIVGPVIIPHDEKYATIPIRVAVASGTTISSGSTTPDGGDGTGLHLGITHVGANRNWNVSDTAALVSPPLVPPDKQSAFVPTDRNLSDATYYQFNWNIDGSTYRRYYVNSSHNSAFTVNVTVAAEDIDKRLAVRLLDRDRGEWLEHNPACEVDIKRAPPPTTPNDVCLNLSGVQEVIPAGNVLNENGSCSPPPPPPPPAPGLEIRKTIVNRTAVYKPGDELTYLIQYRNTVNASLAENVVITDELNTNSFDIISITPNQAIENGLMNYAVGDLAYSTTYKEIRVRVRLKDQISSGSTVCNASRITASNASPADSSVCTGVIVPCPYDNNVPDVNNPNCTEPKIVCSTVDAAINRTTRTGTFKTTVTSSNPATTSVRAYHYDFGDNTAVVTRAASGLTDEMTHTFAPGEYTVTVRVEFTAQGLNDPQNAECSAPISFEEDQTLGQSKSVRNVTRDKSGAAAEETAVRGGDVLAYTLTTSNSQNYERIGIEVADYVGDILDYATLDLEFLARQGGVFDEASKRIIWKDVKIPANGDIQHVFQIKIKQPIPSTNSPSSLTTDYDCKISNEYGNEITINVECPLVKGIETLPNTGPGTSLVASICITTVVGYFFARSRLLAREMALVKNDALIHGGA